MWRRFAVSLGVWLSTSAAADAQTTGPLRLAEVVESARERNPEIQAARGRAEAAAAMPAQAAAYEDPMFAYEAWNAPESFRIDRADNNILKLSQKVPFPGKLMLAGRVAEREADRARAEAGATDLEVVAAVKRAFWDLWRTHQKLLIYSRDKELVERFARSAEKRYAVGAVSQPDVLRAQVELTKLINRVTTETLAVDEARAELNALLSRPPDDLLGTPEEPGKPELEPSPDPLIERALRERPEVAARNAAVEREETKLRMARLDYLPDFEFTVSRFINFESRNGFGAMASVSLPLAYKYKYDAGLAEARARLESARAELRQVQDRIRREVKQAFLQARTALLQYELFVTTHIPQAEQALESSEISYQTGKIDFLSLIDSVRAVESVHLEHIAAAADFEKASADLERAVGGEVRRGGEGHAS